MKRCCLLLFVAFSAEVLKAFTVRDVQVTPMSPWGMILDYCVVGAEEEIARGSVLFYYGVWIRVNDADGNCESVGMYETTMRTNGNHRAYVNVAQDRDLSRMSRNAKWAASLWTMSWGWDDRIKHINLSPLPNETFCGVANGGPIPETTSIKDGVRIDYIQKPASMLSSILTDSRLLTPPSRARFFGVPKPLEPIRLRIRDGITDLPRPILSRIMHIGRSRSRIRRWRSIRRLRLRQ